MPLPEIAEKPPWLTTKASISHRGSVRRTLLECGSRTVCDSSRCPNIGECWGKGHATFMILGDRCTRDCQFCAIPSGRPDVVDDGEVERVAESVRMLGLKHAVVTSVTRDDLPDGGAGVFASVIRQIRWMCPGTTVEVLIPDLQGKWAHLKSIVEASPDVLGHNLEVVRSLQSVRDRRACYERSLELLSTVKRMDPDMITKSSLMLGLGESRDEVLGSLRDLRASNVDLLTIGQYLPPKGSPLPLERYVAPHEFKDLEETALALGFKGVRAGPLVRSSYDASELLRKAGAAIC